MVEILRVEPYPPLPKARPLEAQALHYRNARAASNETAWATRGQLHLNLLAGDESPDLGNMAVKERSPGTADYKASAGRNASGALFSRMN
jgi:hypothetical protein